MPSGGRLRWLFNRLRSMSLPEVLHRVDEQRKRHVSRYRLPDFGALLYGHDGYPVQRLDAVAARLADMEEAGFDTRRWHADLALAQAGRFRFLGVEWPERAGRPDWHLDPVSGRRWESERYCFDIPYRHAEGMGDVKYVWELNRLQYLQPLAALAARGDEAAAALCAEHLESWLDANCPYRGVAWASGIELALRAISMILVAGLLPQQHLTPALCQKLRTSLVAHGYWLERYPSLYSSANNHRVAEACGLYAIGTLTRGIRPGRAWARIGRGVLESEIVKQFHPDGIGAEQSPTYAAFSAEMFLLAAQIGASAGEPFSEGYRQRLAAFAASILAMADRAGNLPRIGDDDEGRTVFSGMAEGTVETDYALSVAGCIAAFLERPDLAPPRAAPTLRNAVFGLPPAPHRPEMGIRHFPYGGYTTMRDVEPAAGGGAETGEVLWVMDHGPLGYLSIAAHGHADALAVWLHVDGRPVLVDAGTYLYHAGGRWRDYLRGTPAHNTLSVAGGDSSVITGPFNWGRRAHPRLLDLKVGPDWRVEAEHDGFQADHQCLHRRVLARSGPGEYRILDRLEGASRPLPVEIGFLFHPDLDVSAGKDAGWRVLAEGRELLRIRPAGPLGSRVLKGDGDTPRGWYSPAFGVLVPACHLVFTGELAPGETQEFLFSINSGDAE